MIGAGSNGPSPLPSRPDLTQRLNYKSFILPLARQGRKEREHMAMETVWMGGIECMHRGDVKLEAGLIFVIPG